MIIEDKEPFLNILYSNRQHKIRGALTSFTETDLPLS